jgi:hypothetical protein
MLLPCWLLPPLLLSLIGAAPPKPLPGGGGRHPPGTEPCGTWLLTKFGWSEKGVGMITLLPSPVKVKFGGCRRRGKLAGGGMSGPLSEPVESIRFGPALPNFPVFVPVGPDCLLLASVKEVEMAPYGAKARTWDVKNVVDFISTTGLKQYGWEILEIPDRSQTIWQNLLADHHQHQDHLPT